MFTDWLKWLTEWVAALVQGVVDWFVGLLQGGWNWLVDQVPTFTPPDWISVAVSGIGTMMGYVASMDSWVPIGLVVPVLGAVLASYGVAIAVRIGRIIASFATLGGGGA